MEIFRIPWDGEDGWRLAGNGMDWLFSLLEAAWPPPKGLTGSGMMGLPCWPAPAHMRCPWRPCGGGRWPITPASRVDFMPSLQSVFLLALALDYAGINAVAMLPRSAVLNGVLAAVHPHRISSGKQPRHHGISIESNMAQGTRSDHSRDDRHKSCDVCDLEIG